MQPNSDIIRTTTTGGAQESNTVSHLPLVVVIEGPTASGKTALAHRLAERFPIEIISADSRQVWQGFDIGTAKPTPAERHFYRYHGLDLCPPDRQLSAGEFARLAWQWIADITKRGNLPLIVGGSGLYVRAITDGLFEEPGKVPAELRAELTARLSREGRDALYAELQQHDPISASRYSDRNPRRILRALEFYYAFGMPLSTAQEIHRIPPPPMRSLRITLLPPRARLYQRIHQRTWSMWKMGLLEEVRHLLESGYDRALPAFETIGYAEALAVLEGQLTQHEAIERMARRTRNYAKRQITWLRHSSPPRAFIPQFGEQIIDLACKTITEHIAQIQ